METRFIVNEVITKMLAAEEKVVKDVLRSLLKREPTIEDAKDLHMLKMEGIEDSYDLAFKKLKLGRITRNFSLDKDYKMGVTFTPFSDKDFLEPAIQNNKYNAPKI